MEHRHRPVLVPDEPADGLGGVVDRDADEGDVLALEPRVRGQPSDRGHLADAGAAPGGPDVEEDRLALEPENGTGCSFRSSRVQLYSAGRSMAEPSSGCRRPGREEAQVDDPERPMNAARDRKASAPVEVPSWSNRAWTISFVGGTGRVGSGAQSSPPRLGHGGQQVFDRGVVVGQDDVARADSRRRPSRPRGRRRPARCGGRCG